MHTVKWFQVFLFNTSNSIEQIFPCNINNLNTAVWFQITNNDYLYQMICGGARDVMVIVTGYGHGDTSSIPED